MGAGQLSGPFFLSSPTDGRRMAPALRGTPRGAVGHDDLTDAPNFGTEFGRRRPCPRYGGPLPVHRKKDGFPRRPVGPPRNDKESGLSLRRAKRRGDPHPPSPRLPCAKGAGTASPWLRDCPRVLDILGMLSAPISTPSSHPRRRRSAVRRWLGRLMRLALLFVGADAYIGPLLHTTCVAPVGRGDHTPPFQIPFRNLAGGGHTPGAPRRRPPCSVAPVGGGLCPAPLARSVFTPLPVGSKTPPPCRGGPMCPPGHGSRNRTYSGRHIGRPLQNLYQLRENRAGTEACPCLNTGDLPQRASGRCPLHPGRSPEHRSHPVPDPPQRIKKGRGLASSFSFSSSSCAGGRGCGRLSG